MNFAFIEKAVLSYLAAHPEVLEKLVAKLVERLLDKVLGDVDVVVDVTKKA